MTPRNRTVYTVRHVLPKKRAMIYITLAPPKPFIGFAAGSVSPICAA